MHRALHQLQANVSLIVIIQTVKTPLLEIGVAGASSQTVGLVMVSPILLSTFTLTDEMYVCGSYKLLFKTGSPRYR